MGGVSLTLRRALSRHRINTIQQLIAAASSPERYQAIIESSGINESDMQELIAHAKLRQIDGIGAVFGYILGLAGVTTVEQLALEDAAKLHDAMHEINRTERLARRSPTLDEVNAWIAQAKNYN